MIKKILASLCLLLSFIGFSQEGSYSPYSFYGIGDQRFKGTVENRAMGGLTIFPDSIHMNIQNPAAFSALKLTTFTVGGTTSSIGLETESQNETAKRTTLDYFAIGLPVSKKAAVAFGLMPYSSVGYKIAAFTTIPSGEVSRREANGSGGINRVFVGGGYQVTKNFRVGASLNYDFGKVETTLVEEIGALYATQEINNSEINGFSMNAGLMYEGKLNKKLKVFGALNFSPEANLSTDNFRRIATVQRLSNGNFTVMEADTIAVPSTKLRLPSKFSIGGGIGETTKWQAGAEITFQQSKDQTNRFSDITNVSYENAIKYAVGGYYIPNYNSFSSYLSRVTYRAGAKYENTGLIINTKSIWDASGSVGFGFPVGGTFSNINLGLEYGKRGTVSHGLVAEKYFNLSVGFSFNDRWFVKRKYD